METDFRADVACLNAWEQVMVLVSDWDQETMDSVFDAWIIDKKVPLTINWAKTKAQLDMRPNSPGQYLAALTVGVFKVKVLDF